ncbi:MAG: hypothetical protein Altm2KO_25080 [Alteromonas macleodii]
MTVPKVAVKAAVVREANEVVVAVAKDRKIAKARHIAAIE